MRAHIWGLLVVSCIWSVDRFEGRWIVLVDAEGRQMAVAKARLPTVRPGDLLKTPNGPLCEGVERLRKDVAQRIARLAGLTSPPPLPALEAQRARGAAQAPRVYVPADAGRVRVQAPGRSTCRERSGKRRVSRPATQARVQSEGVKRSEGR